MRSSSEQMLCCLAELSQRVPDDTVNTFCLMAISGPKGRVCRNCGTVSVGSKDRVLRVALC